MDKHGYKFSVFQSAYLVVTNFQLKAFHRLRLVLKIIIVLYNKRRHYIVTKMKHGKT